MREISNVFYQNYVQDKRVVIVSHAASLVGSNQGEFIDSFDLVARLNDSIPIPEELKKDVGTRCDILYTAMQSNFYITRVSAKPLVDLGVKVICKPVPLRCGLIKKINLMGHNVTDRYTKLKEKLKNTDIFVRLADFTQYQRHAIAIDGKIPLTGVISVLDLLDFEVSEVFMIGFNFFLEDTYDQYPTKPKTKSQQEHFNEGTGLNKGRYHIIMPQVRHIKRVAERDSRLKMDETLTRILSNIDI